MDKDKNYYPGADVIRILSGFGVVLIHVIDPFLVYPPYLGMKGFSWEILNIVNYAFRFSVPLFVMLSGYLLLRPEKYTNLQAFYKRRFLKVGVPFLLWLVVYFVLLYLKGLPVNPLKIAEFILTVNLDYLYFIVVILELYFLTPVFLVFLKNTHQKSHSVLAISIIFYTIFLTLISFFVHGAKIDTSINLFTIFLPFTAYYLAGLAFAKVETKGFTNFILAFLFTVYTLFGAFVSNGVNNSYVRSSGSINVMIMTFIVFSLLINNEKIRIIFANNRLTYMLKSFSANIFGVYLVHIPMIFLFDTFTSLKIEIISSPMWLYAFIKVAAVFLASLFIVSLTKKTPLGKYVFG